VPGNGTFNLTAIWRALGIKNPEPRMRESIQPVINVGDFSQLVPQHRPPTAMFGGDIPNAVGERPIVQITSRGPGGALIGNFRHDNPNTFFYSEGSPQAGLAPVLPNPRLSPVERPMSSLVEKGTIIANPSNPQLAPGVERDSPFDCWRYPFWMRPGQTIFFWSTVTNNNVTSWSIQLVDIPASQGGD